MHQEIVVGSGAQAFFVEPIERPRRPVSVVVTNASGIIQSATTRCDLDPFETTLAEPAAAGTTTLRLKSTEGVVVGTRYTIARHGVVVTEIGDGCVTLRRALPLALAGSEPFLGCRISAAIDPAWSAANANVTEHLDVEWGYRLAWTFYTPAGTQTTIDTTADLVRTPQLARVTPEDVDGRFPGWLAIVERPADVIAEAFDLVRRDARVHRTIRRARHAFALRELAMLAANVIALEHAVMFRGASHRALEDAEARYQAVMQELARRASLPEPKPAPSYVRRVAVVDEEPPLSVAHANVIDAFMEWLAAHEVRDDNQAVAMHRLWMPRFRTRDARAAAAKVLRSHHDKVGKQARWRVQQMIQLLES